MRLRHPFEWLSASGQKRAFILLLVLTFAVMVSLQMLGGPLKTDVAPSGIVSFEFAGELSLAQSMVDSWGRTGQVYAGLNLGLDYLFLVAYAGAIGLGCALVARNLSERVEFLSLVGIILAWGQFGAALLDAIENYALIRILIGTQRDLYPVVARWCAVPKFLIVAAGLVYIIIGALVAMVAKTHSGNEHAT
jgi:hypothetical protein